MVHQYVRRTNQSRQKDADNWILQRTAVRSLPAKTVTPQVQTKSPVSDRSRIKLDWMEIPLSNHSAMPVQAKLEIGPANDVYEQEADRVAHQVVDKINSLTKETIPGQEIREEKEVQRKSGVGIGVHQDAREGVTKVRHTPRQRLTVNRTVNGEGQRLEASAELEASIQGKRGRGQPLDESVREPMEQEFGADFRGVRVHKDTKSARLNQLIQAKAFTTGEDIFFRAGAYEPGSRGGQELLAHELTHVVQQNGRQASKNPQQHSQVIQRMGDFGIEYETPAEMYHESEDEELEPVPDGEKITNPDARNWYIESDSGHIEFITTRGKIDHTRAALENIAKEVGMIKENTRQENLQEKEINNRINVPLKELSPTVAADNTVGDVWATKKPAAYNGKIQFTGNIPIKDYPALMKQLSELKFIAYAGNLLDQHQDNQGTEESKKFTALHALETPAGKYMLSPQKRKMIETTKNKSEVVVKAIEGAIGNLQSRDELKGLIQLMLDYASQINRQGKSMNLKESITVMTRADFNSIYHKSITRDDRELIRGNHDGIAELITKALQEVIDEIRREKDENYEPKNLLLGRQVERTAGELEREENKEDNIEIRQWVDSVIGQGISGLEDLPEKKDWLSSDKLLNDTDAKAMGKQEVRDRAESGDWLVPFEYRGMPSAQVDATKAQNWLPNLIENLFNSNPGDKLNHLKGKTKLGREMEAYNELRLLLIFLKKEIVRTKQKEQTESGSKQVWKLEKNPDREKIKATTKELENYLEKWGSPNKYRKGEERPDYVNKLNEIEKEYLRPWLSEARDKLNLKLK